MTWLRFALISTLTVMTIAQNDSEPAQPPAPTSPSAMENCDPEMIGFELITGYVFSAPANAMSTINTVMLIDCLEMCQGNDSCQAVNFETGLCILFNSNAEALPGK